MNNKQNVDKTPLEAELTLVDKELVEVDRKKNKYFKLFEDDVLTSQS